MMFPTYDQQWTLVADRHERLEDAAKRRRFLGRARRQGDADTARAAA